MRARAVGAVARLDLSEVLRSRWMGFALVVYALLAAGFVFVGLRESSIVGFTGTGRVLLSFSHALLLLLPLLALMATGQVINQARSAGALELLLSQPVGRWDYFVGVSVVRLAMLLVPLVVVTVVVGLVGQSFGQAFPWAFVGRALGVGASLLVAFVGIGMLVTTLVASQARAILAVLVIWLLSVALLDFALIGVMLQWRVPPRLVFVLAAINPVEAARLALLSAADAELALLGPVGFYLSNNLGPAALMALGLAWPSLVGATCWALGGTAFRRGDVV
ncbi:MAG: ABC transporter permease [Myxococcota bacterium]